MHRAFQRSNASFNAAFPAIFMPLKVGQLKIKSLTKFNSKPCTMLHGSKNLLIFNF
jgi:hypothetical protein